MHPKLLLLVNRIEALSVRERVLALVGVPLLLALAAEGLVFDPARTRAAEARKVIVGQRKELRELREILAAQSSIAPLPAVEQLRQQRDELQARIESVRRLRDGLARSVDWGTVVRSTANGAQDLVLAQLKAMPAEPVLQPSAARATAPAPATASAPRATAPRASAPAQAPAEAIYRHGAELTVRGEFGAVLGYLRSLQSVPGDLRWERLQFSVTAYPQVTAQLTVFTLSDRAETPFN